ncbi:hypothetical protein SmJEL517_g03815 [Synchytrium microbalum]|uniref:Protein kinase domain-containing protein n=1 Tax=Synchytrium microbalum TaxID=1806994 RepID=A0A507C6R9_9FUNG|nr:uncharacterized protein SmJEL517_g03815 [Synchytrium microbalum]TPX33175.1 hypothetical protein SmJEL517_g03815 [Synchytrium microbalum]
MASKPAPAHSRTTNRPQITLFATLFHGQPSTKGSNQIANSGLNSSKQALLNTTPSGAPSFLSNPWRQDRDQQDQKIHAQFLASNNKKSERKGRAQSGSDATTTLSTDKPAATLKKRRSLLSHFGRKGAVEAAKIDALAAASNAAIKAPVQKGPVESAPIDGIAPAAERGEVVAPVQPVASRSRIPPPPLKSPPPPPLVKKLSSTSEQVSKNTSSKHPPRPAHTLPTNEPKKLLIPAAASMAPRDPISPSSITSTSSSSFSVSNNSDNGDDEERDARHLEVLKIMNGTTKLPKDFEAKYAVGELLGDGAFGFVLSATRKIDQKEVAVKFIIRKKLPKDFYTMTKDGMLPSEIVILKSLHHANIIPYYDHYVEEVHIILVTELFGTQWDPTVLDPTKNAVPEKKKPLGNSKPANAIVECSPLFRLTEEQEKQIKRRTSCDLFECIDAHGKLPIPIAIKIFSQIVLAVEYMDKYHIVHRDLKDENIVIDADYNIKIIDFGSASYIPTTENGYFKSFNGTAHFASPEIARGYAYRGPEAEVWCLGVLLYTIIFGENPFNSKAEIVRGVYKLPVDIDEGLRDLLNITLAYEPHKRASIKDVAHHPFIRKQCEQLRSRTSDTMEPRDAATKIQSYYRGYIDRKRIIPLVKAHVERLQASDDLRRIGKSLSARERLLIKLKNSSLNDVKEESARTIQKHFRGYRSRSRSRANSPQRQGPDAAESATVVVLDIPEPTQQEIEHTVLSALRKSAIRVSDRISNEEGIHYGCDLHVSDANEKWDEFRKEYASRSFTDEKELLAKAAETRTFVDVITRTSTLTEDLESLVIPEHLRPKVLERHRYELKAIQKKWWEQDIPI